MTEQGYRHRLHAGASGKPILFVFHGTGGDENQFFDFGRRLLPEATVVSPRGDVSEGGAARFFRRLAEGHYDMEDLARATEKMADFVGELAVAHGASHVLGLGFSNGANILANLMIEKAAFDAVALMHPLIPFAPQANGDLAGKSVLITAGRRDPIAPQAVTQALADYFGSQGAQVDLEWHEGGHDIRPNEIEALQRLVQAYR